MGTYYVCIQVNIGKIIYMNCGELLLLQLSACSMQTRWQGQFSSVLTPSPRLYAVVENRIFDDVSKDVVKCHDEIMTTR